MRSCRIPQFGPRSESVSENSMITLRRTIAAVAVGAAIAMSGALPGSAAPLSGSAPTTAMPDGQTAGKSDGVTLVKRRGRGGRHWRGHRGGRHVWRGHRGGRYYGYRRHRNRGFYFAPFIAAPFLYGGYNYGYPYYSYGGYRGNSCYRECRYEHGPRYCRKYWRRYC